MLPRLRVAALVAFFAGCAAETVVPPIALCGKDIDCPADRRCSGGSCVPLSATGCASDGDCPPENRCLPNGACQVAECIADSDCCPAGQTCTKTCKEFECFGSECQDGEQRECFVACHRGSRTCERGQFQDCDALPVTPTEICGNGDDDDCSGKVDDGCSACTAGQSVVCTTECGPGTQTCDDSGELGACTPDVACACETGAADSRTCGSCGHESGTCIAGAISWSGLCEGEGACEPTKAEWQPCGLCGTQTRVCGIDCLWPEWSECGQEGECAAGASEQRGCTGACGVETRSCGADCLWGEWSDCDEQGGCTQGDEQTQPCGNCGERVSACDEACQWGEFGLCSGEGECKPGEVETEVCAQCGERTRTCSEGCGWSSWGACDGQGECDAGDTDKVICGPDLTAGPCEQGTAERKCSTACKWGAPAACVGAVYPKEEICGDSIDQDCSGKDSVLPDDWEANDTCNTCAWLGTDPDKAIYATFDRPADEFDYYCFEAIDNFNVVGFGEHIRVSLLNQSSGLDGDIALYRSKADCNAGKSVATSANIGAGNEEIDWSETTGTSDDGTWVIQVRNFEKQAAGCYKAYTLDVNGLN